MQAFQYNKELPGGAIAVGYDAKRFIDEKRKTCHGKLPMHGTWKKLPTPCPMHFIFDRTHMTTGPLWDGTPSHGWTQIVEQYGWSDDNSKEVEKGWIKQADTIEQLATLVDLDSQSLASTIKEWNDGCTNGDDKQHGRTMMLNPIIEPPFYAIEMSPSMLNTQGGPRRNEKAQIVRPDSSPIPRLYSAGELGSIYSYLYQGTGNIGECLAFGRIAARHAVAERPWQ